MPDKQTPTKDPAIHPKDARKIRARILKWGREHFQNFPWRTPDKPWHGLIAEILLQRTRALNVVPVYKKFITVYPTPESLAKSSLQDIEKIIFPLGLLWRAPLLIELGSQLHRLGGNVPENYDLLTALPGVGDYAASAWLSFHGGKRKQIVDANVVRLICRITGTVMDGETRRQKWLIHLAELLTPIRNWCAYNYAILDFTMLICSKKPQCNQCPIGPRLCVFGRTNLGMENK